LRAKATFFSNRLTPGKHFGSGHFTQKTGKQSKKNHINSNKKAFFGLVFKDVKKALLK